jgi:hypothetical protein
VAETMTIMYTTPPGISCIFYFFKLMKNEVNLQFKLFLHFVHQHELARRLITQFCSLDKGTLLIDQKHHQVLSIGYVALSGNEQLSVF